ncbi:heavy-metal-associated domain-containing protein [Dyadobacter jiangsuensis]|uniref:Heavy-metal-associated domain-containing protein n=2 Tax=Dyadobacter jiangsuensis TaxID=1591085 RepID=A0A2P8GB42_9BACT|nr:heavy-metal-associated domain-containing protein [Dyadobacter jiangsuensis]
MVLLLSAVLSQAAIKNAVTENVKVSGSCALCETRIESAAFEKNVSEASWNKETNVASVTYDSKKTSLDAILKKIALAGFDNQSYLAPDKAYAELEACCRYERTGKSEPAEAKPAAHAHHASTTGDAAPKPAEADPLKSVLDAYYGIKDALVASDGNTASSKAATLVKAIKEVKMNELGQEQHNVWMKVMKDLDFDADHISETKDVGHQRDHFSSLSENMYKVIKAAKPSQPVYYQHCPMAKEGKGANWLSQIPAIKNPYYGAQMLNCGKTTETLK